MIYYILKYLMYWDLKNEHINLEEGTCQSNDSDILFNFLIAAEHRCALTRLERRKRGVANKFAWDARASATSGGVKFNTV